MGIIMMNQPMVLDLFEVYSEFKARMSNVLVHETLHHPINIIIDDFFQIATMRASDSVAFFDDAGTQKKHLHPVGLHKIMVSSHMQDIFFDEFSEYVGECSYFDNEALEERFVHHQISSICVNLVGAILQSIMSVVIQTTDGQMFFHPDNATLDMAMSDLIIDPIPNRLDVRVTVRFE